MPSCHQMEKAASQSTSVPAFKRTVTQGSSHSLWQMGYQHLCLLTTKQQKGNQAIPSRRYGRLASIICPLLHFCKHLSSSPRSPPCSINQQPGELFCLGLSSLFPADRTWVFFFPFKHYSSSEKVHPLTGFLNEAAIHGMTTGHF